MLEKGEMKNEEMKKRMEELRKAEPEEELRLNEVPFSFLQYHSLFIIEYETQLNNKSTMSR